MKAGWKAIRARLGPVGLSVAAAAITAAGFAALSIADDGDRDDGDERGDRMVMPAPPPGARMFQERLSEEDRQKLEEFRQCMEDNGAPGPPRFDREDGPPEPPSGEERDRIEDAHEACEEKLPEGIQHAGPPGCPPPHVLRDDDEDGDGGENEGAENDDAGYMIPAPAPAPGGTS